jgi:hypothetical protein
MNGQVCSSTAPLTHDVGPFAQEYARVTPELLCAEPELVQLHQQDQQAPHMQQYLSASTAKGMMLRNELQSMMAMPQGAVPAPQHAQGYVQQVYYGPGAVVCPQSSVRYDLLLGACSAH